ncbi:interleukin-1 receptor type 2-like [Rhinophrynus dorsalis]
MEESVLHIGQEQGRELDREETQQGSQKIWKGNRAGAGKHDKKFVWLSASNARYGEIATSKMSSNSLGTKVYHIAYIHNSPEFNRQQATDIDMTVTTSTMESLERVSSIFLYSRMWFPVIVIGFSLTEITGFGVYRLENSDKCQEQITHFMGSYVLNGEPAVLTCPSFKYLQLDVSKASDLSLNLVWTKNESTDLNVEEESRIQPKGESLWFFPALSEDSGVYTCILRNSTFCIEVTMALAVLRESEESLNEIAYEQFAVEQSQSQMICPDLSEFMTNNTDVHVTWYKDGEPLPRDNIKYKYLDSTVSIHINDVHKDDEGYYICELPFTHENKEYSVSRVTRLRTVGQEKIQHPVIMNPNRKTIAAVVGSRLMIPCKVFTGYSGNNAIVWWLANDSYINEFYRDGRVIQGTFHETTESDGQYIEVSLIFEKVMEEDFTTDFKCIASNDYGFEVLPTQLREAASSFSWYIAAIPAVLLCLIIAIIFIYKYRKSGYKKDYSLTKS